jgi:hypothetical protein
VSSLSRVFAASPASSPTILENGAMERARQPIKTFALFEKTIISHFKNETVVSSQQ